MIEPIKHKNNRVNGSSEQAKSAGKRDERVRRSHSSGTLFGTLKQKRTLKGYFPTAAESTAVTPSAAKSPSLSIGAGAASSAHLRSTNVLTQSA